MPSMPRPNAIDARALSIDRNHNAIDARAVSIEHETKGIERKTLHDRALHRLAAGAAVLITLHALSGGALPSAPPSPD